MTDFEVKEKKQVPEEFMVLFWIFIVAVIGFVLYQAFLQPSLIGEENRAGISEIISSEGSGIGDFAPDFSYYDGYGNQISLSDYQDKKPVLLIFWATWCKFCAEELEDLKAFTQEHQNEIQIIVISSGEDQETVRNYILEKDINFLMILDEDRKLWNQYLVRGTPTHFLISKQGKVVAVRPGVASKKDLENLMTMLPEL